MLVLIGHRHTITHKGTKYHVQRREADIPLACVAWRSKQFLKAIWARVHKAAKRAKMA